MSIRVMNEVWERAIEPIPKIILLRQAHHANDLGRDIFPGAELLRECTGLADVSTVRKRTAEFRLLGILLPDGWVQLGQTRRRKWRIDLDALRRHFPHRSSCKTPPSLTQ